MDNKIIYENYNWGSLSTNKLGPKIKKIIENIPSYVQSIIDIGCGNGVITNELAKKYKVLGVDRSKSALQYVTSEKLEASCDNIPLPSQNFDMVFSSELLEHLPNEIFQKTIQEFKRISKKYIYITVPNRENPDKLMIRCPACKYIFNRPNHLRSFKSEDFTVLFPEYKKIAEFTFGKPVRYYHPALLRLKRRWIPSISWIPYFWIDQNNRTAICPQCNHKFYYFYKFHPLGFLIDGINVIISPKRPYWLMVLLEKNS